MTLLSTKAKRQIAGRKNSRRSNWSRFVPGDLSGKISEDQRIVLDRIARGDLKRRGAKHG